MNNNFSNIVNDVKITCLLILVGFSIFVGFATEVNAVVPVTYTCCVNYSYSNGELVDGLENISMGFENVPLGGTQLENFENITSNNTLGGSQIDGFENIGNWAVVSGAQQVDTVNFKEGIQGLELFTTGANKTVTDLPINYNFSNTNNFGIWLYIPDTTNFSYFRVYFTSGGSMWNKYFTYSKYNGFNVGWNKLIFDKSEFTMNTTNASDPESWGNTMNRVRIAIYPTVGSDPTVGNYTNATVDDLRVDVNNDWVVSGVGSSQQADTVNFKEGQQGLNLSVTGGNRADTYKAVYYDLSNTNNFGIWLYVPDNTSLDNFYLFLTSTGGNWSKYFQYKKWVGDGLNVGWNKLTFDKGDFTNTNNESWNNRMNRIKLSIVPRSDNTSVTVDDLRYNVDIDPGWKARNGIVQNDTVNFKEGSQGLKLITTDVNGSTIEKTISKNFSDLNNIAIWTYIDDASNLTFIRLYLTSNGFGNSFFYDYIYQNFTVKSGWNKLVFNKHNFINVGGESWNNVMDRVKLSIGTRDSSISTGVTFDDLRKNMTGQRAKLMIEFDDGEEDVFTKAFPILSKNNQTATGFIVPNFLEDPPNGSMNVAQLHILQDAGWDISSHTMTHNDTTTLNDSRLTSELNDTYDWLVSNNFQKTAGFLAFPYGSFNDRVINFTKKRYIFARATVSESAQQHFLPDDDAERYIQRIIAAHNDTTLQKFKDSIDDIINAKLLGIVLFHNVEDSNPTNDMTTYNTSDFQKFSDYIKSRSADIDVITESDYVIPNINNFTPVLNKNTRIYSNGSSVLITNNKYDEYMPNMTITPSSDYIDVNVTKYDETEGIIIFNENESSQNTSLVSYDILGIPNKNYSVEIYLANGTKYDEKNITADSTGHINYNSTGFVGQRYQTISYPFLVTSYLPNSSSVVSIKNQSQQFSVSISRNASITWLVDSNVVQTDINTNHSGYLNSTADIGIHNVTAIADDGIYKIPRTWNWSVINTIYNIVHQKYIYQNQTVTINFSLQGYIGMKAYVNITSPNGTPFQNITTMKTASENESIKYNGLKELGVYNVQYSTPNITKNSTFEYKQKPVLTFVSASDLHYGWNNDTIASGFTINRFISDINNKTFFSSPDFVVLLGDTVDTILNNNVNNSKNLLYNKFNVPYFVTTGDHESLLNDTTPETPSRGQTFYNAYGAKYNYTNTTKGYTFIFGGVVADYPPLTNGLGYDFGTPNYMAWLDQVLASNAYKPTIVFQHTTAQAPRDDPDSSGLWLQDEPYPNASNTRYELEKYGNTLMEVSGDAHIVSKVVTNNITYVVDGAIINQPYMFDYVEIYPDKIQVHAIPYRLDTDSNSQYEGPFYHTTDSKHTQATYNTGNPDENDFTISIVDITSTKLTNLWNFTANNITTDKMTFGNNNIILNNTLVNLSAYESRNKINMTVNTSNGNNITINITKFDNTSAEFNESSPTNGTRAFYNIGDRIPNQTYNVKIYWANGTLKENSSKIANSAGYITYNSTGFNTPRYQIIAVPTSPPNLSIVSFYPPSDPTSNGTVQLFNITLNKNANVTWYINGSQVQTDPNVNLSSYTNSSASVGTYNVTVLATDGINNVSRMWNWTVNTTGLSIVSFYPPSDPTSNGTVQLFNITLNKSANVIWYINGSQVKIESDVNLSNYTNSSANVGTYNVTVSATDGINNVSRMWNWTVNTTCNVNTDVNRDGIVDIRDIVIVGQHFGQTTSPPYPLYDVNGDGIVDIRDIVLVGQQFGQSTCWK